MMVGTMLNPLPQFGSFLVVLTFAEMLTGGDPSAKKLIFNHLAPRL